MTDAIRKKANPRGANKTKASKEKSKEKAKLNNLKGKKKYDDHLPKEQWAKMSKEEKKAFLDKSHQKNTSGNGNGADAQVNKTGTNLNNNQAQNQHQSKQPKYTDFELHYE